MRQPAVVKVPHDTTPEELRALEQANSGDERSRDAVRALMVRRPELVQAFGTRAACAERSILSTICDGQIIAEEAIRAELRAKREELSQPGDGALERVLVERTALCWLATTTAEQCRAERWSEGVSPEMGLFWDRHVGRLHHDFLRACAALARVRRLRRPALQVNVAAQQVNVVG